MFTEIYPTKKISGVLGTSFIDNCDDKEATHWCIDIGFDGTQGVLILPSLKAAEACMESFVLPYEGGIIGNK